MADFKTQFITAGGTNNNSPCGRYAPSPTGPLHMGNSRTALLAWLQARLAGGRFILRMDDLDLPRVKAGSAEQLMGDLRWLGLDWDEGPDVGGPHAPYNQSERAQFYQVAFETLQEQGLVYPCYCSRKDIQEAASAPHQPGYSMKYPGTCRLDLGALRPNKNGLLPAWRYRVGNQHISYNDQLAGKVMQDLARDVGDFIIKRRDGLFAYQLATVVDDIEMGVSDVLRGEDLLDSAPRQIALIEALSGVEPQFWHVPLLCDANGQRLSKRDGAASLLSRRQAGARPEQVVAELAMGLGLNDTNEFSAQELLEELGS